MTTTQYALTGGTYALEPQQLKLVLSRVRPFLNPQGLQTRTIEQLMLEAYMAGIKDTIQVIQENPNAIDLCPIG